MPKGEAGGAYAPPDFGRSEGATGSSVAPHYCTPPQIFRLWHMPGLIIPYSVKCKVIIHKSRVGCIDYGTEIEILAGFGLVGSTEKNKLGQL